jgi:hypothetical protein
MVEDSAKKNRADSKKGIPNGNSFHGCECDRDSMDSENQPHSPECDEFPRGHTVSTAYVGSEAAREAAEAFYRKAPAYIETLDRRALDAYFCHDDFGFGVQPHNYMTAITIFLDRACSKEPLAERLNPSQKLSFLSLSGEALAVLFGNARKKPKITLLVKDEKAFFAIRTLEAALPLYGQLKALGVSVTIVFMYARYSLRTHTDQVFTINLGAILEMPRPIWAPHFVAACRKQDSQCNIIL